MTKLFKSTPKPTDEIKPLFPKDIMPLLTVIQGIKGKALECLIKIYSNEFPLTTQDMKFIVDYAKTGFNNDIVKAAEHLESLGSGSAKVGIDLIKILPEIDNTTFKEAPGSADYHKNNIPGSPCSSIVSDLTEETLGDYSMFDISKRDRSDSLGNTTEEEFSLNS